MTFGLLLTIILGVLDYTGQAELSLTQILIPVFVELGIYVLVWLLFILGVIGAARR